jgi:hypothetical protein
MARLLTFSMTSSRLKASGEIAKKMPDSNSLCRIIAVSSLAFRGILNLKVAGNLNGISLSLPMANLPDEVLFCDDDFDDRAITFICNRRTLMRISAVGIVMLL